MMLASSDRTFIVFDPFVVFSNMSHMPTDFAPHYQSVFQGFSTENADLQTSTPVIIELPMTLCTSNEYLEI